jgi:hypothetical protein
MKAKATPRVTGFEYEPQAKVEFSADDVLLLTVLAEKSCDEGLESLTAKGGLVYLIRQSLGKFGATFTLNYRQACELDRLTSRHREMNRKILAVGQALYDEKTRINKTAG